MQPITERMDEIARRAVGNAMLAYHNRVRTEAGSLGTITPELTAQHIKDLADSHPTPDTLTQIIEDVAKQATKDAANEADRYVSNLVETAERMAVKADSLSLYQFVERLRTVGLPKDLTTEEAP